MHGMNLRAVNLNLLTVLQGLLTERSITRAATRLNMSQPAVSHALARLRHVFNDQLLIRCGREMVPTSRANEIGAKLESILSEIVGLFEQPVFDPGLANGRITICATEGAIGVLLNPLLQARAAAPSVFFELRDDVTEIENRLRSGSVHLYIDSHVALHPAEFRSVELFRNKLKCVARKGTLAEGAVDRKHYEEQSHIVIAGGTNAQISAHLEKIGVKRKVAIVSPGYFSAASAVSKSDLLLTLPKTLALHACDLFPVEAREPGFKLPEISLLITWHMRHDNDPLHRWVRRLFIDIVQTAKPFL